MRTAALEFAIAVESGKVISRRLTNRLTRESVELPTEEFALEFEGGRKVVSPAMKAEIASRDRSSVELLFTGENLQVRAQHSLAAGKSYIRKQLYLRQTGGTPVRLLRADLDNWRGVERTWRTMTADRLKYGSHPIFCETWWAGVEFVAAFNEIAAPGFVLRSRPGGREIGADWVALHSTVAGVAERGAARDAFLAYLEDIRVGPPRLTACYNSWWTLPKVVIQRDNLVLIRELKSAMFDKHGVFFDVITTDMGWSNPRSIWEIDRSILPVGFDDIGAVVEAAGGRLGVWMSPSEEYPPVCDYDWAEKNGYVVLRPAGGQRGGGRPAVSLADPRYRNETKAALRKLIRESRITQIKYDGFLAEEDRPHHGLLPGIDSVEPLAEYMLELMQASKQENPHLVTEPTCMNSWANYISPWILKYSDTVWGNSGGDCPPGIGPAPDYRESHTNAREFFIFSSLNEVWVPQNAVHYFDIVHVDSLEGFPNHAAMAFGRGRFFVSTYLNPKLMNDEDWRIYAGLLKWSRANSGILRNTRVLPSRVEDGEPYVYAHWLGKRGILAVRNPSNESCEFTIDLRKAGAPPELADAVCYAQYPCRKGIAAGLSGASRLSVHLAPWELTFLEIVPRAELNETVAIGARWYGSQGAQATIVAEPGVARVRILEPGGAEHTLSVEARARLEGAGRLLSRQIRPVAENDWLATPERHYPVYPFHYPAEYGSKEIGKIEAATNKGRRVQTVAFEQHCEVSVPGGASGKVLLLVEYSGREYRPSECTAHVDGAPAKLERRDSGEHVGYYTATKENFWKEMLAHECEWCWYICDVAGGSHRVRFTGRAGHSNPRIRLWVWVETDLRRAMVPLAASVSTAAMPQYRAETEHHGIAL